MKNNNLNAQGVAFMQGAQAEVAYSAAGRYSLSTLPTCAKPISL